MSFFLAEIKALELHKYNKQLTENLIRSLSSATEEERDGACTGESHDGFSSTKEVDLYVLEYGRTQSNHFIALLNKYQDFHNHFSKSHFAETPSQPPEA
jgi:hypothetical protein